MKCIIDIECNSLINPSKLWLVICKDIETNQVYKFRNLHSDEFSKHNFLEFSKNVESWIGHNILEFDLPILVKLVGFSFVVDRCIDTLVISRLLNYSMDGGHSLRAWGIRLGLEKVDYNDWTKWSQELEDYCAIDVEISHRLYTHLARCIHDPSWHSAISLEQQFQLVVNDLHNNGFYFNVDKANKLLEKVTDELLQLDGRIRDAFPAREILIREFTPKPTRFGTISKTSVPRSLWDRIHEYEVGRTYRHTRLEPFNPSSHKQLIEVLNDAGWKPEERTSSHIRVERELRHLRSRRDVDRSSNSPHTLAVNALDNQLVKLNSSGWKVNELNLSTLPASAPEPARHLAKRILLEARRRSLVEWLGLVKDDGRIHGKFVGIGAWTHRMAHQLPNTANIPTAVQMDGTVKLLGKELRSLWCAPKGRLLVGVDAEGIQLRIFAHYIDDAEFTDALVRGSKADKTDPHSLNQRILGSCCKTRQASKRFVYALLLGGGLSKLAQILECSKPEAEEALNRLLARYTGFAKMRETVFPQDAQRGYFIGLDGRKVLLPGATPGDRKHLAMSGYLQNGEAIIIKKAAIEATKSIRAEKDLHSWSLVNVVHDELQSEVPKKMSIALRVAEIISNAIREAGEYYKLKCPMAGSYYNDDIRDYTIGTDWYQTH